MHRNSAMGTKQLAISGFIHILPLVMMGCAMLLLVMNTSSSAGSSLRAALQVDGVALKQVSSDGFFVIQPLLHRMICASFVPSVQSSTMIGPHVESTASNLHVSYQPSSNEPNDFQPMPTFSRSEATLIITQLATQHGFATDGVVDVTDGVVDVTSAIALGEAVLEHLLAVGDNDAPAAQLVSALGALCDPPAPKRAMKTRPPAPKRAMKTRPPAPKRAMITLPVAP